MKRTQSNHHEELALTVADEMVRRVKIHAVPITRPDEAIIMVRDALAAALIAHPLRVLNLMQTNKALLTLWDDVANLWILLLERVIDEEQGGYFSEVYPFFVVQNRARRQFLATVREGEDEDEDEEEEESILMLFGRDFFPLEQYAINPFYAVMAHRPVAQLIGEIYVLANEVKKHHPYLMPSFNAVNRWVQGYLGLDRKNRMLPRYSVFKDYVMLAFPWTGDDDDEGTRIQDTLSDPSLSYDSYQLRRWHDDLWNDLNTISHGPLIGKWVEVFESQNDTNLGFWPLASVKILVALIARSDQLQYTLHILEVEEKTEKPQFVEMNETFIWPFRELLYNPVYGVYNTPAKQKALFLNELRHLHHTKEETIVRYGQAMDLACTHCAQATPFFDGETKLAFCNEACRSVFYSGK